MFAKKNNQLPFFVLQAVLFLGCGNIKAGAQHGMNNAAGARRRSHHGLLHGEDLLTVDLPQSAGVAFQRRLQATSGLEDRTQQVQDPQSTSKEKQTAIWHHLMSFVVFLIHNLRSSARCKQIR